MITPDVGIGLSFYQDKECLKRCLLYLKLDIHPFFKVFAIDGRYKGFNSKSPLSTDGSREVVRTWRRYHPKAVYLYDYPNLYEWQKRQKYVDIVSRKNIDWLLVLDSDEFISVFNQKLFFKELNSIEKLNQDGEMGSIYGIRMYDVEQNYRVFRPRLWFRPEKIGYKDKHNQFTAKKIMDDISADAIQITHYHGCRSQKRQEQQKDYEYRLESLEKKT
jgi:hypothetical protein